MVLQSLQCLFELNRTQWMKKADAEKRQNKRLRSIIKHAYSNVEFYNRKFKEAGIKLSDIRTVSDLHKIPFTYKSEIQKLPEQEILAKNVNVRKIIAKRTSGSTGIPLKIFFDKKARNYDAASWIRAYLTNGVKPWDKFALVVDPHSASQKQPLYNRFGILRREYITIFDDVETQIRKLQLIKPNVIQGYPSVLALLAREVKKECLKFNVKRIFTEAELLNKLSRLNISSGFNCGVYDLFATREFGLIAWECKEHFGYHINSDNLIVEFVRNGETVREGERGEITCTSLTNYAMPLIRYRLGDVGIPLGQECPCGRSLPLMKVIEGRANDLLITPKGKIISPLIFHPFPFQELEFFSKVEQFRIVQEKIDEISIDLVMAESFREDPQESFKIAEKRMKKVFGEKVKVAFNIVERLPRDPSGKLRTVISKVSVKI